MYSFIAGDCCGLTFANKAVSYDGGRSVCEYVFELGNESKH